MKTFKLITIITCAFLMLLTLNAHAQDFKGLDKSPMDAASFPSDYKVSDKLIKILLFN